jgi:hypothetical protein
VFPSLHAPQHLLLAVGRHAIEALQALFVFLLALARKTTELRIILECVPLLIERLLSMLVQPLA